MFQNLSFNRANFPNPFLLSFSTKMGSVTSFTVQNLKELVSNYFGKKKQILSELSIKVKIGHKKVQNTQSTNSKQKFLTNISHPIPLSKEKFPFQVLPIFKCKIFI